MRTVRSPETEEAFQRMIEIEAAARHMLDTVANMTTRQFLEGEDRVARRRLAEALGLDPDDYSLFPLR